jgi:hypothetical protein
MPIKKKPAVKKAISKPAVKKAISKPAVKKAIRKPVVKQANPQLSLFTQTNLDGTRRRYRGNLGVRNLGLFGIDNDVESLTFTSDTVSNATLVLFSDRNYQGSFQRFVGNTTVQDLADFNFEDRASSFIMANFLITPADVTNIQNAREAPSNFGEVLAIIRKGRAAKKKK